MTDPGKHPGPILGASSLVASAHVLPAVCQPGLKERTANRHEQAGDSNREEMSSCPIQDVTWPTAVASQPGRGPPGHKDNEGPSRQRHRNDDQPADRNGTLLAPATLANSDHHP
jgi:hypothetical protein